MRGFQQQRIKIDDEDRPALEAFDYIAGLSGGNFPNIQYAFAQNVSSDELLDADGINDPTLITKEELERIPENSLFSTYSTSIFGSLVLALAATVGLGFNFLADNRVYSFP